MNKKTLLILTALLLAGCSARVAQLNVPESITYNNKSYQLAGSQDLETIARYVYVAKPDTLEHWQSQIEVLFDRNHPPRSIKERIALRERVYHNTGVNYVALKGEPQNSRSPDGLSGAVIYAPTEQNPMWQVNVMKGRNISQCGFVQFQYSQKVQQPQSSRRLTVEKVQKHLLKYVVEREEKRLQTIPWTWACQK